MADYFEAAPNNENANANANANANSSNGEAMEEIMVYKIPANAKPNDSNPLIVNYGLARELII